MGSPLSQEDLIRLYVTDGPFSSPEEKREAAQAYIVAVARAFSVDKVFAPKTELLKGRDHE